MIKDTVTLDLIENLLKFSDYELRYVFSNINKDAVEALEKTEYKLVDKLIDRLRHINEVIKQGLEKDIICKACNHVHYDKRDYLCYMGINNEAFEQLGYRDEINTNTFSSHWKAKLHNEELDIKRKCPCEHYYPVEE